MALSISAEEIYPAPPPGMLPAPGSPPGMLTPPNPKAKLPTREAMQVEPEQEIADTAVPVPAPAAPQSVPASEFTAAQEVPVQESVPAGQVEDMVPLGSNIFSKEYWKRQATRMAEGIGKQTLSAELLLRDIGGALGGTPNEQRKEELRAGIREAEEHPTRVAEQESVPSEIVSGLVGMGPQAVGLVTSPFGMMATFGLGQFIDTYGRGRAEGASGEKSALTGALAGGESAGLAWAMGPAGKAAAGALGRLGMDRVIGTFGDEAVKHIVANALVGAGIMPSMNEAVALTEKVAYRPDMTWGEYLQEVEKRLPREALVGAAAGAAFGAAGPAMQAPGRLAGRLAEWQVGRRAQEGVTRLPASVAEERGVAPEQVFPPVAAGELPGRAVPEPSTVEGVAAPPGQAEASPVLAGLEEAPEAALRPRTYEERRELYERRSAEASAEIERRLSERRATLQDRETLEPFVKGQEVEVQTSEGQWLKTKITDIDESRGEVRTEPTLGLDAFKPNDVRLPNERRGAGDYAQFDPYANQREVPNDPLKVSALRRLRSLQKLHDEGRIGSEGYIDSTKELLKALEEKRAAQADVGPEFLARGPAWIQERLIRAGRTGELAPEAVDMALWFLGKNPAIGRDLAVSIRELERGKAGTYDPVQRIMKLARQSRMTDAVLHEMLHHTEKMLPLRVRQGVINSWSRALARETRKAEAQAAKPSATQEMKTRARALRELPLAVVGDDMSRRMVFEFFKRGVLKHGDYQLSSPSEFWAMNASRVVEARYRAEGWVQEAKQWLMEFLQKLKALTGMRSDATVLRGLRALSKTTGEQTARELLQGSPMTREEIRSSHMQAGEKIANALAPEGELDDAFVRHVLEGVEATPEQWRELSDLLNERREGPRVALEEQRELINGLFDERSGISAEDLIDVLRENLINDPMKLRTDLAKVQAAAFFPDTLRRDAQFMRDQKRLRERLDVDVDRFSWLTLKAQTLLQIAKKNPRVPSLHSYVQHQMEMWQAKQAWTTRANRTLKKWEKLGKEQSQLLSQAKLEETVNGRFYAREELLRRGMTPKTLEVYDQIQNDFKDVLTEMENASVAQAVKLMQEGKTPLGTNPIADIRKDFATMRNRPYFPLARFGEYGVSIKANRDLEWNGKQYKKGRKIAVEMHETGIEQRARLQELRAELGQSATVSDFYVNDRTFEGVRGLPSELAAMVAKRLNLAPEQLRALHEMQLDLAPTQSFIKHLKKRRGIEGFSQDAIRAYAAYFQRGAGWLSRLQFMDKLDADVRATRESARELAEQGLYSRPRERLAAYMDRQLERIRHPESDLSALRAFGFIWYLGFNVKAAAVNMTQVPMMTLPYLWHRHGLARTTASLAKSYAKVAGNALDGLPERIKDKVTFRGKKPQFISPEEQQMMKQGESEGWLDESQASMLAGYSDPFVLARLAGGEKWYRDIKRWGAYSGWMFQRAEMINRKVTALSAYELERGAGASHDEAVEAAHAAVNTTQFEYAAWNRPEMMQGKKSALFLFSLYNQHVLHFAFGGDPAWKKFWMVQLAIGGILGLPGSQDLLDVFDLATEKIAGIEPFNSKRSLRLWLDEHLGQYMQALHVNSDLLMHGISRYSFGLTALGAPALDFSGSVSLGNIKVGPLQDPTSAPFGATPKSGDEFLSRKIQDLGGPLVSLPFALIRGLLDDKTPDQYKRFSGAIPVTMKAIGDAWKSGQEPKAGSLEERLPWWLQGMGGYTDRKGDVTFPYDFEDAEQRAEHNAKYFNFTSTAVNKQLERHGEESKIVEFYQEKRAHLLASLAMARQVHDREAISDAFSEIRKFNETVPLKELGITGASIQETLKRRETTKYKIEHQIPQQKRLYRLYRQMQREDEDVTTNPSAPGALERTGP